MTTDYAGLKVIIAEGECQLERQRRIQPLIAKKLEARRARGARHVRRRRGHLHRRPLLHPALRLPVAHHQGQPRPAAHATRWRTVIDGCVGCGLCGEIAHAAVLCPSFYRAEIVQNPNAWDRFMHRVRQAVIGWLQPA